MVEPGLEAEDPAVDLYIHTGNDAEDETVARLLEALDIEQVIKRTLAAVHIEQPVMLTVMLTSDEEIQVLNLQYRQQDKPTDVLSFPLLDEPLVQAPAEWLWQLAENEEASAELPQNSRPLFVTPEELLTNLGDIAISWPTIQRQALAAGHDVSYELLFLLSHGVLHLVGYDDQTEAGYTEMVRLQKEVLASLRPEG
jgi:probable rRNA maturation factor